jgi:hypothetical protein
MPSTAKKRKRNQIESPALGAEFQAVRHVAMGYKKKKKKKGKE